MTNSQKWVAAFLAVFTLLLVLGQLTKNTDKASNDDQYYDNTQDNSTEQVADAQTLMNRVGCTQCHGMDFNGTAMAPGLKKAKDHWTKEELIKYIKDPSVFADDERLKTYKENFRTVMPSYQDFTDEQLSDIADFILTIK